MSSSLHKSEEKCGKRKGGKRTKMGRLTHPAVINDSYQQDDFKAQMKAAFTQQKPLQHETQAALHTDPFTCCVLPNFLQDDKFLEGLRDELMDQIFCEKNNDLYKFQQTDDLRKLSSPHVRAIRRVMGRQFLEWMRDVTGIPLTDRINIMCSRYDYTDVLLCHDDELDTRRIAFILYLIPPWSASDGGTLDLYNMDEHGQADSIVRSLVPQHNSVAWFEVTAASHHQVSEVVATDKMRLSVHGWFYAPPVPRPARYVERPLPLSSYIHVEVRLM
ncbi:hypothetical protein NP493_517g00021 [Ridgeia piscesae]|uniref:Prolyl 4-hydroxylase alpha subunit domain-containing protein n=1 Tax=Ridgeia piscesae TaxID=27915 RepID=A0AAD9KY52_RIDPI|nr:hypothetical protein NP493_517g00021 [Ridgeia piscesae]